MVKTESSLYLEKKMHHAHYIGFMSITYLTLALTLMADLRFAATNMYLL